MKDVEFCWNCHDEFVFMAWPNSLLRSVSAIGALWILLHAVQMWVAHNNKTIIESTQYVQLRDLLWMVTILLREFSIVCAKYTKINWRQIAICMSALILKWEQQEISPDPYLFTVFTDGWWKTLRISFPIVSCRARLYKKYLPFHKFAGDGLRVPRKGHYFDQAQIKDVKPCMEINQLC